MANATDIKPISTVSEFTNIMRKMTPVLKRNIDPVAFFQPKIECMHNFSLGAYQWCVVDNASQQLMEVGGMTEEMTGKTNEYWRGASPEKYLHELAVPEELPYLMAYISFIYQYILQNPYQHKERSLHPHIYLRMKDKMGKLRNVLMQFIDWIIEEDGKVRYCLCQVTDISHIRQNGPPQMTILEVNKGKNKLLVSQAPTLLPGKSVDLPSFTIREKEVLRLLAGGLSSKMIAEKLGIALNTVDNHRQRLLKKAKCPTSGALTAYVIRNGLI